MQNIETMASEPSRLSMELGSVGDQAHGFDSWLERAARVSARCLVIGLTAAACLWLAHRLSSVLVVILLAVAQVALLAPAVDWCGRHGVPRVIAVLLGLLIGWGVAIGLLALAVSQIVAQRSQLPIAMDQCSALVQHLFDLLPGTLRHKLTAQDSKALTSVKDHVLGLLLNGAMHFSSLTVSLVISSVLAAFTLSGRQPAWSGLLMRLPKARRHAAEQALHGALRAVRTWASTSCVCAAFDAAAVWLALSVLAVPLAPAVGLLTFVLAFVPLFGALVAGIVAVLIASAFQGPGTGVAVLVVVLVVQQLEGSVLAPWLLGRGFRLHPTVILVLTLLGGSLLGVAGMVFAVPLAGAALRGRSAYRETMAGPPPEPPTRPKCERHDLKLVVRLLDLRESRPANRARAQERSESVSARMAREPARLDGKGMPVLLVTGMACRPEMLQPLAEWLKWLNFQPHIIAPGHGLACGEWSAAEVSRTLAEITEDGRGKAVVIAHSRGGQFARAAAFRSPHMVSGLITLGSPLATKVGLQPRLAGKVALLAAVGTFGVGGVVGLRCLLGRCCRQMRHDLTTPLAPGVRFVSVFSRNDTLVRWTSCLDPSARLHQVTCNHHGLVHEDDALDAIERELEAIITASCPHGSATSMQKISSDRFEPEGYAAEQSMAAVLQDRIGDSYEKDLAVGRAYGY
jgi:predicted PurR-regulated permease PerM/pimeloyl-ACP methyl ester carboxylesterase